MKAGIPIYVVNLAWATQRKSRMVSQLNEFNLPFELVTASDGNFFSNYDNIRYSMDKTSPYLLRLLTAGEKGCVISHRHIYEMILNKGQEYALILEDDAILTDNLLTFLDNIKNLPQPWNLIYLGYYIDTLGDPFFVKSTYPISLWRRKRLSFFGDKKYTWGKFILRPRGAFGYLITHNGAKMILEYSMRNNAMLSDRYLSTSGISGIFGVTPRLIYHDDEKIEKCILGRPLSLPTSHSNFVIRLLNKFEIKLINKLPIMHILTNSMRLFTRRIRATLLFILSPNYGVSRRDVDR